jgi:hypothetical protein
MAKLHYNRILQKVLHTTIAELNGVLTRDYRLAIRAFLYDVQTSILLWKGPMLAYSELDFALPAAHDLWKASTPQAWWELSSVKGPLPAGDVPRLSDIRDCMSFVTETNAWVDIETCCKAALHGLWGQVWAYRCAIAPFHSSTSDHSGSDTPLWTQTLYQSLYSDLRRFSDKVKELRTFSPGLLLLSELFMMILHVSLDDVQRLAGRKGEEESRRAAQLLEKTWLSRQESRYAVWHAGQVLRYAEEYQPTGLRGFNAMVVYLASLTLWAYGLVSQQSTNDYKETGDDTVSLNGSETGELTTFLETGQGTPSLASPGGVRSQLELSNCAAVLSLCRLIFRQNYPTTNEAMPPLIEGLCRQLGDLQSRVDGQMAMKTF